MVTKEKALYQVKLILDYLPKDEYKLIPQETIDYIEDNFEYDENITIDPKIPLDKQKIDDKAYDMLEKIIKQTKQNAVTSLGNANSSNEINEYIESVKKSNESYDAKIENIRLNNIIELLKKENDKLPKAKELLENYQKVLKQKDDEIAKLKECNQNLYTYIQRVPKFFRKIFIGREDVKLLDTNN